MESILRSPNFFPFRASILLILAGSIISLLLGDLLTEDARSILLGGTSLGAYCLFFSLMRSNERLGMFIYCLFALIPAFFVAVAAFFLVAMLEVVIPITPLMFVVWAMIISAVWLMFIFTSFEIQQLKKAYFAQVAAFSLTFLSLHTLMRFEHDFTSFPLVAQYVVIFLWVIASTFAWSFFIKRESRDEMLEA